jgi:hypothetical protein
MVVDNGIEISGIHVQDQKTEKWSDSNKIIIQQYC